MPKVTIVKPNNTYEQEKDALRSIADVMEKIVEEEFGTKVKIELFKKIHKGQGIKERIG